MKTRTIGQKLKSTKLWCAVAGVTLGIVIAVTGSQSEGEIQTIAGCITSLISAVTYIIVEGKIDASSAATIGVSIQKLIEYFAQIAEDMKKEELPESGETEPALPEEGETENDTEGA